MRELMNFLQQETYEYETFIRVGLRQHGEREIPSSKELSDDSRRRRAMRSLLIAITALLTVSFGVWAFVVLVVLEH